MSRGITAFFFEWSIPLQRQISTLLMTLGLAILPTAASAQAGSDADVRCLLVSNTFAEKETDPQRKQLATLSISFYLGRVDARLSPTQFRAAVTALSKEAAHTDFGTIMTACAKNVIDKQVAVSKVVRDISQAHAKGK